MATPLPYLRSAAATISYVPAAYVRLEWHAYSADSRELQAVYDHVLRAMNRHGLRCLMSIHGQRPPIPPEVQAWLANVWVPRAAAEAHYSSCAIVEAVTPLGRLAARALASNLTTKLNYRYFVSEAEAETWLIAEASNEPS